MKSTITIPLKTFTFYVNEVARLVELNRRLQKKLQTQSRRQAQQCWDPPVDMEIIEELPAAEDEPEIKVAEAPRRPARPAAEPEKGWTRVVSRKEKRKQKKAQKKHKASSKGIKARKESSPNPRKHPTVAREVSMDIVEQKSMEPIPAIVQEPEQRFVSLTRQVTVPRPCHYCKGYSGGFVCHGFANEMGERRAVPVIMAESCLAIRACQTCCSPG